MKFAPPKSRAGCEPGAVTSFLRFNDSKTKCVEVLFKRKVEKLIFFNGNLESTNLP